MRSLFLTFVIVLSSLINFAQGTGINSTGNPPDPSAGLDVSFNDKGMLVPRLTTTERNAIVSPANGLLIFNITTNCFNFYRGGNWFELCGNCIAPPTPVVTSNGAVCSGDSIKLYATFIPNATYSWTGPNGFSSTLQNPKIPNAITAMSGTYSVIASTNGCVSNATSINVIVTQKPVSTFTFSPSSPNIGQAITFSPTVTGASYNWSFTGGSPASSTVQNPSVTWASTGTYLVSLIVTQNGCISDTTKTNVSVVNCTHSSQTFSYTGGAQTWTVPGCITSITVDAYGAQGGASYGAAGGLGGRVQCTLAVTPGSTLNIFVGQQGQQSSSTLLGYGGYNGGGSAPVSSNVCGGGGGATDIRVNGTALSDRVVVAGAGAGSGQGSGGAGGGLTGGQGSTPGAGVWATGGTQSAGGNGGLYNNGACAPGAYAQNGSLGQGGNGITGSGSCTSSGGSGGGGGYYGGGGMQINGAGGGSSYTGTGTSNVTHTQGANSGNGSLTITW
ncbi:MAG: glycine-rich protein [Bacteroidota bacterium]